MSDDRKDMTTTATCQLVDLLYAAAKACQQTAAKLAAVEAERDEVAKKLAEVEDYSTELSKNHHELRRQFIELEKANRLWVEKSEMLQEQLTAADKRIADLTAPVVGDYHCGPA